MALTSVSLLAASWIKAVAGTSYTVVIPGSPRGARRAEEGGVYIR
jgi:hypothetical protein